MKLKKIIACALLPLITSCSTPLIPVNPVEKADSGSGKMAFGVKAVGRTENTALIYTGPWTTESDPGASGGNVAQSTPLIEDNSPGIFYGGSNWVNYSAGTASGSSYSYNNSNSTNTIQNNSTSNSLRYFGSGWVNAGTVHYANNNNTPFVIENTFVGPPNNVEYRYNSGLSTQTWASTMVGSWSNVSTDTVTSVQSNSVVFNFNGTNIGIYQTAGASRGIANIKIFDVMKKLERDINVDLYNTSSTKVLTAIKGLKGGEHKVVITGTSTKNPSSGGFNFGFDKAIVYPAVELEFNGSSIEFFSTKSPSYGRVDVILDGDQAGAQRVDLYSATAINTKVFEKLDLPNGKHRITLEATPDKNPAATNYRIALDYFRTPFLFGGNFNGTILNLKILRSSNSGIGDLFIDGVFHSSLDFYNPTSSFGIYSVGGLPPGNHSFMVKANGKSYSSSGYRISFDGLEDRFAEYSFTGTGINYYATKSSNGGMADVFIDNGYVGTCDLYSPAKQNNSLAYAVNGLVDGPHVLKIVPNGKKNANSGGYLNNIDYLQAIESLETLTLGIPAIGSVGLQQFEHYSFPAVAGNRYKVILTPSTGDPDLYGARTDMRSCNDNCAEVFSTKEGLSEDVISYTAMISGTYYVAVSGFAASNYTITVIDDTQRVVWAGFDGFTYHIYTKSLYGSPVVKISDTTIFNQEPEISTNGDMVVWKGFDGSTDHIYSRKADGSGAIIQLSDASLSLNNNPKISADGKKAIWFGTSTTSGRQVFSRNVDGSGSVVQLSAAASISIGDLNISGNGNLAVWKENDGVTDHVYSRATNGSGAIIKVSDSATSTWNWGPSINHNGSRVTWSGWDGATDQIYIRNTNGTGAITKLSDLTTGNQKPKISADGSKVIWVGSDGTNNHIYLRNADGSGVVSRISDSSSLDNNHPEISGDGTIATWYSWDGTDGRIFASIIGSPSIYQLSGTSTANGSPMITKSGFNSSDSFVVWYGNDGSTNRIYGKIATGSGTVVTLSDTTTGNEFPGVSH